MKFLITGTCAFAIALAGMGAALPAFADATMPTCAAGDSVVWENSSTKVYHAQGDSYFGKTKHGQYACKSDADKAGYHLAGSKSSKSSSAMAPAGNMSSTAAPMTDASASPTGKKHHHHRHGGTMMASPSPAPAAT